MAIRIEIPRPCGLVASISVVVVIEERLTDANSRTIHCIHWRRRSPRISVTKQVVFVSNEIVDGIIETEDDVTFSSLQSQCFDRTCLRHFGRQNGKSSARGVNQGSLTALPYEGDRKRSCRTLVVVDEEAAAGKQLLTRISPAATEKVQLISMKVAAGEGKDDRSQWHGCQEGAHAIVSGGQWVSDE